MDEGEVATSQQHEVNSEIFLAKFTVFIGTCIGFALGSSFLDSEHFQNGFLVIGATLLLGTTAFCAVRILEVVAKKKQDC